MADENELVMAAHAAAAGAGVGGRTVNRWARHGREDLQASHSLTAPVARWAPEVLKAAETQSPEPAGEQQPYIAIPAAVLHARPPLRLPEDSVCRSPIAGLVIAVSAVPGQAVSRHEAVMVVEAMKMQNDVSPEVDGVLKAVHVAPGDAVKAGQILFELE